MPGAVPIEAILRFGDDWKTTHDVLNALATPIGRRYCQPARYPKKRLLAEAWVEVRDKWVAVLRQIDAGISADNLPWDDGRYNYYAGFYYAYKYRAPDGLYSISIYVSGGTAKYTRNFTISNWSRKHLVINWDPVLEKFELL